MKTWSRVKIEEENKRECYEEKSDLEQLSTCVIIYMKGAEISRASRDCHLKVFYFFFFFFSVSWTQGVIQRTDQRRAILNAPICCVNLRMINPVALGILRDGPFMICDGLFSYFCIDAKKLP